MQPQKRARERRGGWETLPCSFPAGQGPEAGTPAPGGTKQPPGLLEIFVTLDPITGFQKCEGIEICTDDNL